MPEHNQYDDVDLFNPETHHESSDVPVTGLLWFVVIFLVFSLVSHFVILFLYKGFVKAERRRMDPPPTTIARAADADVPQNQPLLQPFPRVDAQRRGIPPQSETPVSDLQKMRDAERQVLEHYGWVDKQHGVVHIPIEDAKQLLAAKLAVQGQLGTGAAATPATSTPSPLPGSSPSPAGTPVPPDTGVPQPATTPATSTTATSTSGGAHP
jgi:hypothetical protein